MSVNIDLTGYSFPSWVKSHAPFRYHFYKYDYQSGSQLTIPSSEFLYISLCEKYGSSPPKFVELIEQLGQTNNQPLIFEINQNFLDAANLSVSIMSYNLSPYDPFEKSHQIRDIGLTFEQDETFYDSLKSRNAPVYKKLELDSLISNISVAYYAVAEGEGGYLQPPVLGKEFAVSSNVELLWEFYITTSVAAKNQLRELVSNVGCFAVLRKLNEESMDLFIDIVQKSLDNYFDPDDPLNEVSFWISDPLGMFCLGHYKLPDLKFEKFLQRGHWNSKITQHYIRNKYRFQQMHKEVKLCYNFNSDGTMEFVSSSFYGII